MRRVAAVLFGILVALLLLEGTLQALAYATLRRARAEQRPFSERAQSFSGRRVLCVGDSYTYGIGAKSRGGSYPARLEEYLRAGGGEDWIVVNEGWPSRNSQELNDLLPNLLQKYEPDWVVVLIGINDRWNEARPASAAVVPADPNAWVWRWRTKRLFEIAFANLRGNRAGGAATSNLPHAAADSTASAATSAGPDSTPQTNLASDSVVAARSLPAGSDTVSVLRRRLWEVVESDTSKHATPEQRKQVYDVAEEARRLGNEELAIDVVEAYSRLKMHTFAVEEGEAALKSFGESPRLARALVLPLQRTHQEEKALRFAERSVALDSTDAENWRALASARFLIPDPKAGLRALLEFQKRGGDDAIVARQIRVRNLAAAIPPQELEQTIQDSGLDEQDAAKVRQLFGSMGDAAETEGELFTQLSAIAAQIKARNARPLFLNYPTPGALAPAAQNESIARVAQREGIPYLDLHLLLEQESAGQPRDVFFIADGHCTDRGYDIVAKAVAAKLVELDRQTPSS